MAKTMSQKILTVFATTAAAGVATSLIGYFFAPKETQKLLVQANCLININSNNSCNNHHPNSKQPKFFAALVEGEWVVAINGEANEQKRVFVFGSDRSKYFEPAYPPKRRAEEVANRMNRFASLDYGYKFIVTKINTYDVVCGASPNGDCKEVIFTVRKGQDAQAKIPLLQSQLAADASKSPLYESACATLIDFKLVAGSKDEQSRALTSQCKTD
jgi:Circadian oscillating protein COP23